MPTHTIPLPWRHQTTQFWHPEGVGRDALLSQLEPALRGAGFSVIKDDGWQPYDLRVARGIGYIDITTVTEYHEGGQALTRVRLRPPPTMIALLGLGAVACPILLGRPGLAVAAFGLALLAIATYPYLRIGLELDLAIKKVGGQLK